LGKQRDTTGFRQAARLTTEPPAGSPLQIRGGWLAKGHQPLDDRQVVPASFKPDHPRLSA